MSAIFHDHDGDGVEVCWCGPLESMPTPATQILKDQIRPLFLQRYENVKRGTK